MGRGGGRRSRPARRGQAPTVEGTLRVRRPGSAVLEAQEGTFVVARGGIREGMDGDVVRATVSRSGPGGPRAYVQSVMCRARDSFLGTYGSVPPLGVVVPLDERIRRDFFVLPGDGSAERLGVSEGDLVQARIVSHPTRREAGVVTIERRVGASDEVDLDVESVVASFDLPVAFPPAALEEAAGMRVGVGEALRAEPGRRDLRGWTCLTVDPPDARDFDDALSVRRTDDGGFELGVHIADVAHYVRPEGSVDLEARARGCSVYLADRVLPMLPERLSCDVCSLRPGEDRLCMTVVVRLSPAGEVLSSEAFPSAIRSRARLDYDAVDLLLSGNLGPGELACADGDREAVSSSLRDLDGLAGLRGGVRARRGAIDFETAESKVVLGEGGEPVGVRVRRRTRATSLVEEAMLLANECVADALARAGMRGAYRTHARPVAEGLASAVATLRELGLVRGEEVASVSVGDPFAIQAVIGRAKGTPAERLASEVLLRAQSRAVYSPDNEGHYALGARAYCHFTSPIRRYPDLVAHRSLKALLGSADATGDPGGPSGGRGRGAHAALAQLCRACSERERRADAAARASQRAKLARLYLGRVGEVEPGVVSGVGPHGMFVELAETLAEGLVPLRAMGGEWVELDERRMLLRGESSGREWRPGQRVAVRVTDADPARGRISLALVTGAVGRVPGGIH